MHDQAPLPPPPPQTKPIKAHQQQVSTLYFTTQQQPASWGQGTTAKPRPLPSPEPAGPMHAVAAATCIVHMKQSVPPAGWHPLPRLWCGAAAVASQPLTRSGQGQLHQEETCWIAMGRHHVPHLCSAQQAAGQHALKLSLGHTALHHMRSTQAPPTRHRAGTRDGAVGGVEGERSLLSCVCVCVCRCKVVGCMAECQS